MVLGQNAVSATDVLKAGQIREEGMDDNRLVAADPIAENAIECKLSIVDELVQLRQGEHALLMCEVGMGRGSILQTAYQYLKRRTNYVWFLDYSNNTSSDPMNNVIRKIRSLKRAKQWAVQDKFIIMDNVSVENDDEVERLANQVRRVADEHFSVIIGTLPEGEILMEELQSASAVYWSCDLCLDEAEATGEDPNFYAFTHNIPSLAKVFLRLNPRQRLNPFSSTAFVNRYNDIVESMQREQVFGEQRALIAVMLMLGKGTRSELEDIMGNIDYQVWRSLARDEPLLGVDVATSTFRCAGSSSVGSLASCVPTLQETISVFEDKVLPCCRHLIEREQYDRAAVATQLISDKHARCKFTFPYSFRFLNELECSTVFDAYSHALSSGWRNMEGYAELGCCLRTLFYESGRVASLKEQDVFPNTVRGRYANLSSAVRRTLKRCDASDVLVADESDDEIAHVLVACGQGLCHAFGANLEDGLECVSASGTDRVDGTVVGALARTERVLFTYLLEGEIATEAREACLRDQRALADADLRRLTQVLEAALHIPQALFGHEGDLKSLRSTMEFDWQNASAHGDSLFRAALYLGMGACDLRGQGHDRLRRALVEFDGASRDFGEGGAHVLAAAARLLALCAQMLDRAPVEKSSFMGLLGHAKELDRIVWLVMDALKICEGLPREMHDQIGQVPKNFLWLLAVLGSDLGRLSEDICERFPESWKQACDCAWKARRITSGPESGHYVATLVPMGADPSRLGKPLRINVLGGFEVVVRGEVVSSKIFNNRKANTVLILLAASSTHIIRRGEILESVFPGDDFRRAGQLLNQATSLANKTIRKVGGFVEGETFVCSDRFSGIVSLNSKLVECDTDLLTKWANSIGDHENDDRTVVTIARRIEDVYRGDLHLPDCIVANSLMGRDLQLQGMFVDSMVMGAESAGAISRNATACRMITLAYRKNPMREDVVIQYIKAFNDSGRRLEAEKVYDEYVLNLMVSAKTPPSNTLRRVAASCFVNPKPEASRLGDSVIDIDITDERPVALEAEEEDGTKEPGSLDFDYIGQTEGKR